LEGRFPFQRLEVFGEVVRGNEAEHMSLETIQVIVMERSDSCFLDRSVHPLGLAVGPGMVRLCQPVLDAMLETNAIEDMRPEETPGWSLTVLGQIGEGHSIVGQDLVYLIRKGRDDVSEEGGTFHFPGMLVELDVGELRDPVYGEEHDEFSVGVGEFGAVDVDIANIVSFEPLSLFRGFGRRESGDVMALKATVQSASAQVWNGVLQTAEDVIQRQECPPPEFNDDGFLGGGENRALRLRPHRRVVGVSALSPFQDGFDVEAILAGEETGRRFRCFELGSNSRRRAGAAVKNACHSASSS
jgi:hypothetical protein